MCLNEIWCFAHWLCFYLSHTKFGRQTRCLMTINKTKIKKLTTATVANSAISPLAFNAVRLNGFTAWKSDGITTRNDIFETSTSGSDVWFAFFSIASDCRLILFDVISGWSSPQFTWACENWNRIVIWTKMENQC